MVTFFILTFILSLGLVARLPYLDFPIDEDFGFYAYLGHFRGKSVRFIKDFWGGIFPISLYLESGVYKLFRGNIKKVRLFFAFYNTLTGLSVFSLASCLGGEPAGLLAAFFYLFFSSAPNLGTYSISTEKYYVLPINLSALCLLTGMNGHEDLLLILSGLFMGFALIWKPVVLVSAVVFPLYIFIYGTWMMACLFCLGVSVALFVHFSIVFIIFFKDLKLLWMQYKLRYFAAMGYIGSILDILERFVDDLLPLLKETAFIWVGTIPYIIICLHEQNPQQVFILFWMMTTVLTLVGQRAFWQYHYVPLIPIFSLCSAISVMEVIVELNQNPSPIVLFVFLLLLLSFLYSTWNLLQSSLLCKRDRQRYFSSFRKMEQYLYFPEVANYIRKNSQEMDYIYVWGTHANLYLLSDRRSCEKSITDFVGPYKKEHEYQFDETMKGIIEKRPKFIIQVISTFNIEVLNKITGLDYKVDRVFYNKFPVYRLSGDAQNGERMYKENEPWELKIEKLNMLSIGMRKGKMSDYYLREGMKEKYIREFQEALAINPYDLLPLVHLGIYFRSCYEHKKAVQYLETALSLKKNRPYVYAEMALTWQAMGDLQKMRENIAKFKKYIFPYKYEYCLLEGIFYRLDGQAEKSVKRLKWLLKNHYPVEWLYFEIGQSLRAMGRTDEAIEFFQKELERYPDKQAEWFYYEIGLSLRAVKRTEEAVEFFQKELERYPDKQIEWLYYEIGLSLRDMGRIEEAVEFFEKELERHPDKKTEWFYYEVGLSLRDMGRIEEAVNFLEKELGRYPGKPVFVYYHMASLLKTKGELDEAAKHFLAIANDGNSSDEMRAGAFFHMGNILESKNKIPDAVFNYKKCRELIPHHKKALERFHALERTLKKEQNE